MAEWFQGPAGQQFYLTVWVQTWENISFYPVGQVYIFRCCMGTLKRVTQNLKLCVCVFVYIIVFE